MVQKFEVMLEGRDEAGSYFVTVVVAATSREHAESMALLYAKKGGSATIRVEETSSPGEYEDGGGARVLSISGRSYFPSAE